MLSTKILSKAEIQEVVAELKRKSKRSKNSLQNLIIFRLATCCGLRVSEISALKISNLKLEIDRPYIYLPKSITKGHKSRRVPLCFDAETLRDLQTFKRLRLLANDSEFFVCCIGTGLQLDRRNLRMRFKTACKILGQDRCSTLTIHDGRHTFCSHALHAGIPLTVVRDAVGHSNLSTTSIYSHVVLDSQNQTTNLFS